MPISDLVAQYPFVLSICTVYPKNSLESFKVIVAVYISDSSQRNRIFFNPYDVGLSGSNSEFLYQESLQKPGSYNGIFLRKPFHIKRSTGRISLYIYTYIYIYICMYIYIYRYIQIHTPVLALGSTVEYIPHTPIQYAYRKKQVTWMCIHDIASASKKSEVQKYYRAFGGFHWSWGYSKSSIRIGY